MELRPVRNILLATTAIGVGSIVLEAPQAVEATATENAQEVERDDSLPLPLAAGALGLTVAGGVYMIVDGRRIQRTIRSED